MSIDLLCLSGCLHQGWQFLPGPERSGRNQHFLAIQYYFTKYLLKIIFNIILSFSFLNVCSIIVVKSPIHQIIISKLVDNQLKFDVHSTYNLFSGMKDKVPSLTSPSQLKSDY